MARLPDGEPAPADGALPAGTGLGTEGFGVYLHVPFCASRCGYCDFNTYTATELGGLNIESYLDAVLAELRLAEGIVRPARVDTVFVGGGTPTMLSPSQLGRLLDGIDKAWGLAAGAEVTTEANPESVGPATLKELKTVGFTRISLGMQSASPNVLRLLDRQHTPGRATEAAQEARAAGFDHVNLDLIYGTPGETDADFAESLDRAIGAGVDHVSAYSLIVEDGTRLAGRVRRGELAMPDDDVAADRYLLADRKLTEAGLTWYEVSNWATGEAARCRHNMLYWHGGDWWGLGPGAHSHIGGVRWWNVKHPARYAALNAEGKSPALGREVLTAEERRTEHVLLRLRLAEGLPATEMDLSKVAEGMLRIENGRATLTLRGRLMADAVVRDLLT